MTTIVTTQNDLAIINNNLALTVNNSDAEIEQRLRENLQTFLGEWFLNVTIGVPYLELVFVKGVAPILIESAFKDVITGTPGVLGLTEFSPVLLDTATRQITVNFAVRTENNSIIEIGFES